MSWRAGSKNWAAQPKNLGFNSVDDLDAACHGPSTLEGGVFCLVDEPVAEEAKGVGVCRPPTGYVGCKKQTVRHGRRPQKQTARHGRRLAKKIRHQFEGVPQRGKREGGKLVQFPTELMQSMKDQSKPQISKM